MGAKGLSKKEKIENQKARMDSYKYWSPELIEWIARENDPVKLSVTSCLLNTYVWPEHLPGKPKEYTDDYSKPKGLLFFVTDLLRILRDKSHAMVPGLHQIIWMTKYYRK